MSLGINGYNAQFNQFVQFAEQQMRAGNGKAVADMFGGEKNIPKSVVDELLDLSLHVPPSLVREAGLLEEN